MEFDDDVPHEEDDASDDNIYHNQSEPDSNEESEKILKWIPSQRSWVTLIRNCNKLYEHVKNQERSHGNWS